MAAVASGYRPGQRWVSRSSAFLCKRVSKTVLSPCMGSISGFSVSFQSGGVFLRGRALTIEHSVMSGCSQGHEPAKNL